MKYSLTIAMVIVIGFVQTQCLLYGQTNLPSGVTVPMPPFTNNTEMGAVQEWRQSGIELMCLKNIAAGDTNVCFSRWIAPTSIVVNANLYNVSTGICSSFSILSVDTSMPFVVDGFLIEKESEKEARIAAFAEIAGASCFTPNVIAARYLVNQRENGLLSIAGISPQMGEEIFQSKNIYVRINAPTNAVDFAVAILNAGLPENERIPVE